MLSYKEIVKINEDFANAHHVIQNFGAGEVWQIAKHDQFSSFDYPLMYMERQPASYSKGEFVYSFRIWFLTRVESPKDRQEILFQEYTDAISTMTNVAQNLVSYWVQDVNYPDLEIDTTGQVEPETDVTEDKISGVSMIVNFKVSFNYDLCLIPMASVPTPPIGDCADATYRNSDSSFTQNIASGATYISPDINVTINGDDQGNFPANQDLALTFTCPPSGPVDTSFNGIATGVDTPSGQSLAIGVTNSTPSLIGTLNVNTANAKGITISDSPIQLEGVPFAASVPAEGTLNIELVDQDDNTLPATTVTDSASLKKLEITVPAAPINVANLYKTGITISRRTGDDGFNEEGRGTDWFNLGHTNPYGHGFRFTGNTGGYTDGTSYFDVAGVATTYALAFPNDEMLDWAYYDQVNGTVPMWYLVSQGTLTPSPALPRGGMVGGKSVNTAVDEAFASTQNGYTDWYLPNIMEFISILYWAQNINNTQGLNYLPFEFDPTIGSPAVSSFRLVTGSYKDTSNASYWVSDNGVIAFVNPTVSAYGYFMKRNADISVDLGL